LLNGIGRALAAARKGRSHARISHNDIAPFDPLPDEVVQNPQRVCSCTFARKFKIPDFASEVKPIKVSLLRFGSMQKEAILGIPLCAG
jgi:hypothetical protein